MGLGKKRIFQYRGGVGVKIEVLVHTYFMDTPISDFSRHIEYNFPIENYEKNLYSTN